MNLRQPSQPQSPARTAGKPLNRALRHRDRRLRLRRFPPCPARPPPRPFRRPPRTRKHPRLAIGESSTPPHHPPPLRPHRPLRRPSLKSALKAEQPGSQFGSRLRPEARLHLLRARGGKAVSRRAGSERPAARGSESTTRSLRRTGAPSPHSDDFLAREAAAEPGAQYLDRDGGCRDRGRRIRVRPSTTTSRDGRSVHGLRAPLPDRCLRESGRRPAPGVRARVDHVPGALPQTEGLFTHFESVRRLETMGNSPRRGRLRIRRTSPPSTTSSTADGSGCCDSTTVSRAPESPRRPRSPHAGISPKAQPPGSASSCDIPALRQQFATAKASPALPPHPTPRLPQRHHRRQTLGAPPLRSRLRRPAPLHRLPPHAPRHRPPRQHHRTRLGIPPLRISTSKPTPPKPTPTCSPPPASSEASTRT